MPGTGLQSLRRESLQKVNAVKRKRQTNKQGN